MAKNNKKQWWQGTFDDKYLKTYIDAITPQLTASQINFLLKVLGLKKGAPILDLACGYGRHSIELAKKGLTVTGLDYSKFFIAKAKKEAALADVKVTFIQQDMRQMKFKNKFEAIVNMFTSFGYFDNDADNILVLQKISQALKKGGKFLIDLNNLPRTIEIMLDGGKFDKKTGQITKSHKEKLSNGFLVTTVNRFNPATLRWGFTRSWRERGRLKTYTASVRLFTLPELKYLMAQNGLVVESFWGDFNGAPYGLNSRRLIILARKKY